MLLITRPSCRFSPSRRRARELELYRCFDHRLAMNIWVLRSEVSGPDVKAKYTCSVTPTYRLRFYMHGGAYELSIFLP